MGFPGFENKPNHHHQIRADPIEHGHLVHRTSTSYIY